jgi:hypothetical protein
MRHRTTFALLIVFFAGLGVLWWADLVDVPTREERALLLNRVLPELVDVPVTDIARIEVDRGSDEGKIAVERRDEGRWQLLEPVNAAADPTLVDTLVRNLKDLRKSSDAGTIHEDPDKFGLKNPKATVRLFGSDTSSKPPLAVLQLGKILRDRVYVRAGTETGAGIEVVDSRLLETLNLPPVKWRDMALFRLPAFRVESVSVDESSPERHIKLARDERHWRMVAPVKAPADDDRAEGLVAELAALRVAEGTDGLVADDVLDFATYGLDKPSMTITMTPFSTAAKTQVLHIGSPVPRKPNEAYARRADQDDVVRLDVKLLKEAIGGRNALRSQKVLDFTPNRVDRIRVEVRGTLFDLAKTGAKWEMLSPSNDAVDNASVQMLLARLAELKSSEFLEPTQVVEPRIDPPSYRIRIWQPEPGAKTSVSKTGGEPSEEPRADLRMGRHDGLKKMIFGQIAGDTMFLALSDSVLEDLPRNKFAFRNRAILSLRPEQFSRIAVERAGVEVVVEAPGATGAPGRWKMVAPVKAPVDDEAVTGLAMTLSNLHAESWESEQVGDGKAFGLDRPWLRIKWSVQAVGAKGVATSAGTSEATLRVGKVKPGGERYYSNIEGDPKVFALNATVIAPLEAELRSRAIMSFKPEQAQRIVLRWPSRTLALRKSAGAPGMAPFWEVETGYDPSGFDLTRVDPLIVALSDLKAARFTQYSGTIPDSAGLSPPLLSIQVTLAGDAKPRTIRLGNSQLDGLRMATDVDGPEGPVFALANNSVWKELLKPPSRLSEPPTEAHPPNPFSSEPAKPR